jgi:hypothetical protein
VPPWRPALGAEVKGGLAGVYDRYGKVVCHGIAWPNLDFQKLAHMQAQLPHPLVVARTPRPTTQML